MRHLLGRVIQVIVISGCTGTGAPLEAIDKAFRLIASKGWLHGWDISVEFVVSFEIGVTEIKSTAGVASALRWALCAMGDLRAFPGWARSAIRSGSLNGRILLAVGGPPCKDVSRAQRDHGKTIRTFPGSALHVIRSHLAFVWHEGLTWLGKKRGQPSYGQQAGAGKLHGTSSYRG